MAPTLPTTPTVFISYRRGETAGHAGRLYDAMVARFGESHVFMDVDMQPGVDFVERIRSVVAACHVLLVVIGPEWARALPGETQPRLADPEDFVRLEVATALSRDDVTVIPLLVERAEMPDPDDLPENLRALTRRNALELNDLRWHDDTGRLMEIIEQLLAQAEPEIAPAPAPAAPSAPPPATAEPAAPVAGASATVLLKRYRWPAVAAAAVIALLLVLVLPGGDDTSPPVATAPVATQPGTNTGASEDPQARPAGVPASCRNRGATDFATNSDALRQWSGCSVSGLQGVTGASLTYLEFSDAATAAASLEGARTFELTKGGYEPCDKPELDRVYSGEAWCAQIAGQTLEIYWHDANSRLMGVTTFAFPTTVSQAVQAWSTIV